MEFDYEKYKKEQLIKGGLNPDDLSDKQINVILQPSEAPEIYMCDGEITPQEAFNSWIFRLKQSGLTKDIISKAIGCHFS